jgi:hypothetical protein
MNQANAALLFARTQCDGSNLSLFDELIKERSPAPFKRLPLFGRAHPFGIVCDFDASKDISNFHTSYAADSALRWTLAKFCAYLCDARGMVARG